ncbi:MAG: AraC family transcriptional regulator [Oscillospiraceae bacterium]|nr:AraC family transcriptional regulator [Oscillospiraceae bacterium]
MDWVSGMQKALDYIEENLCEEISIEEAARKACSSVYHFQRVFGILCGRTVGEYIRLRRLTLAGAELAADRIKVIDAAMKYGYDSPDSFTKAFVKFHGITPSRARCPGVSLRSFARLSIKISLEGGTVMNYRIEKKPAMTVTGLQTHLPGVPAGRSQELRDLFKKGETRFVRYAISGMARDVENEYYVISNVDGDGYDLTVGGILPCYFREHMEKTVGRYKELLTSVEIPAQTYVVAETSRGINCMTEHVALRNSVVSEWLPSSGYVLSDAPEVVVIHFPLNSHETNVEKRRADDYVEIWLPIKREG